MVMTALVGLAIKKAAEKKAASKGGGGSSAGSPQQQSAGRDITDRTQTITETTRRFTTGAKSFNVTGINLGSILQPFEGSPANGGVGAPGASPVFSSLSKKATMGPDGLSYGKESKSFDLPVVPIIGMVIGGVVLMVAFRNRA